MDSYGSYEIIPVQENMGDNNHHTISTVYEIEMISDGKNVMVHHPGYLPNRASTGCRDLWPQMPKQHQSSIPRREKKKQLIVF